MELSVIEVGGMSAVEGQAEQPFMAGAGDAALLIEACMSYGVQAALLSAANLPAQFFDLSSGQAGEILQKLRNYRIRLAVICPPGSVTLSRRFEELMREERRDPYFGLFDTREAALAWLAAPGA
jgi:hypothetical protein